MSPDFTPTREELEGWGTEQLYLAATECDSETGPKHCWRCVAWDIWETRVTEGWPVT